MVYTMDKQKCFSKMDLSQFMTDAFLIEKNRLSKIPSQCVKPFTNFIVQKRFFIMLLIWLINHKCFDLM
jgi:hypothetical protein